VIPAKKRPALGGGSRVHKGFTEKSSRGSSAEVNSGEWYDVQNVVSEETPQHDKPLNPSGLKKARGNICSAPYKKFRIPRTAWLNVRSYKTCSCAEIG